MGEQLEVLLFGLGAIGGFYAFILGRNESVKLSVVARSNYESVKTHGLKIESENHGNHTARIDNVYKSPSEAERKFDYIVCTNKATDPTATPKLFKDIADDRTTFVIMQNGVGNEDPFRAHYPKSTILSAVVWVGAIQEQYGTIKHWKNEGTEIGLFPNPEIDAQLEKHRFDAFVDLLRTGETVFSVEENVQIKRWEKVVWNCAINGISTLTRVDSHAWLNSSPEAIAMHRRLMREVIDVANRCGVAIGYELIDHFVDKLTNMQPVYSSMYKDAVEGRTMEVEVILGVPVKKAREFGMDVPVLSALYAMITAIDVHNRQHAG